jgi:hypothetical protein
MGGSAIPIPPQTYVDAANTLYLQPRDFTGTPQALDTPEGFYPTTGVNSLTTDASEAQGAQILNGAITGQIAGGNVDAANPVVVFGYSQMPSTASATGPAPKKSANGINATSAAIGSPIAASRLPASSWSVNKDASKAGSEVVNALMVSAIGSRAP